MWKIRQKSTGLFWTGGGWAKLEGNFHEQGITDLDEEREMVDLIPAIGDKKHAHGILILATDTEVRTDLDWQVQVTAGKELGTFRAEVSGLFRMNDAIILWAVQAGSWGNLRAGTRLYCQNRKNGFVAAPGFIGGSGPWVEHTEEVLAADRLLETLLGSPVKKPHSNQEESFLASLQKMGMRLSPGDLKHPVTGEPFVKGDVRRETGLQRLGAANGEYIETCVGGAGMLRAKLYTASGSWAEGYVDGGAFRWMETQTVRK